MVKITIGIALILVGTSVPGALSWGNVGHEIVGLVAQNYLTPQASSAVASILGADPTYSYSALSPAATWADLVKYKSGWGWTKGLHFADTNDSPPNSCGYVDTRDCPAGGCLVSAITNYTSILCSSDSTQVVKSEALKFITHFFGDITQPLHVCGRDVGGNSDPVTFDGSSKLNLHHIWDTEMVVKHMTNDYGNNMDTYAQALISNLNSGSFSSSKDKWAACVDPTLVGTTGTGNLQCPILWAQDTNGIDCGSSVWTDYLSDTSADLGGAYYEAAYPIIDQQLAKGGYRLGLYLNNVFNGCSATPTTATPTSEPTTTSSAQFTTSSAPMSTSATKTKTTRTPKPTSKTCSFDGEQYCSSADGTSRYYIECDAGMQVKYDCGAGLACYQSGNSVECN